MFQTGLKIANIFGRLWMGVKLLKLYSHDQ
jgi:hypothetical protein